MGLLILDRDNQQRETYVPACREYRLSRNGMSRNFVRELVRCARRRLR